MLLEANELMDIQEKRASLSPTRRIADYTTQSTPTPSWEVSPVTPIDESINNVQNTASALSTSVEFVKPYRSSMELLRDSRRRAQKRLSRSEFEKQKAEEKMMRIKAKMEQQLREVETSLKEKIDIAQIGIDEEVCQYLNIILDKSRLIICDVC